LATSTAGMCTQSELGALPPAAPPACRLTRPRLLVACRPARLYRPEQRACAIKVLNLDAALDEIEDIQKEIAVLALCRCPSIVGFHRAFVRGPKLWIVMDLMVGSALDLVRPIAHGCCE